MGLFKSSNIEYIIVGLGNPEPKYDNTRHNSGFCFLDYLSSRTNINIKRLKFKGLEGKGEISGHSVLLVKPQTYMNSSGECVAECARFYKLPPERIIVVFDDISLPVGKVRVRRNGSHGGQNGVKSIIECLGSSDFPRVKIGIGDKPNRDYDLANWVLSSLNAEEKKLITSQYDKIYQAVEYIMDGDIEKAMAKAN